MPPLLCRSWLHLRLFTWASVGVHGRELEKGWPMGEGKEGKGGTGG